MKLLEKYSLDCGINPDKLEKVEPYSSFATLNSSSFVLFSNHGKEGEEKYPFMQELFDILKPILDENKIDYYFLPKDEADVVVGCPKMSSNPSIDKISYIAKRSRLFVGISSVVPHLFAIFDKSSIVIYNKEEKNKTEAYDWDDSVLKESVFFEKNAKEILPETLAQKVIHTLKLENQTSFKTLYAGDKFPRVSIEVVPDLVTSKSFAEGSPIAFRIDFLENPRLEHFKNAIESMMERPGSIVLGKPISEIFSMKKEILKSNLKGILFNLTKKVWEEENKADLISFIDKLNKIGTRFVLAAKSGEFSEEERGLLKLAFIDICTVNFGSETSFEEIKEAAKNGAVYKSSRFIFSDRKKYLSKQAWIEGKDTELSLNYQSLSEISNLTSLQKELESSLIFTK